MLLPNYDLDKLLSMGINKRLIKQLRRCNPKAKLLEVTSMSIAKYRWSWVYADGIAEKYISYLQKKNNWEWNAPDLVGSFVPKEDLPDGINYVSLHGLPAFFFKWSMREFIHMANYSNNGEYHYSMRNSKGFVVLAHDKRAVEHAYNAYINKSDVI